MDRPMTTQELFNKMAKNLTEELAYDCEPLQYLLIDGRFRGAAVGHFRYGPCDLSDIVCDLPDAESRRDEILQAVMDVNPGGQPKRFMGKDLLQISVLNQKCTSGYPRIPYIPALSKAISYVFLHSS